MGYTLTEVMGTVLSLQYKNYLSWSFYIYVYQTPNTQVYSLLGLIGKGIGGWGRLAASSFMNDTRLPVKLWNKDNSFCLQDLRTGCWSGKIPNPTRAWICACKTPKIGHQSENMFFLQLRSKYYLMEKHRIQLANRVPDYKNQTQITSISTDKTQKDC